MRRLSWTLNIMATKGKRLFDALFSAASASLKCGFVFFLLGASSAFLVTGDGHASAFTYFMMAVIDVPIDLLHLEREGKIISASICWGAAWGLVVFVYRMLRPLKEMPHEIKDVSI